MDDTLTDDQFRILRNARDGIEAPAGVRRPGSYFFDVELLVRARLVTPRPGGFELTPLGAAQLRSRTATPEAMAWK